MTHSVRLDQAAKTRFLASCPAFRALTERERTVFAELLSTETLAAETVLDAARTREPPPLRIVFSGAITVDDDDGRIVARAGDVVGIPSVLAWHSPQFIPSSAMRPATATLEISIVLQLAPDDFPKAFGRDPDRGALRAILAAHERATHAAEVMSVLGRLSPFSFLPARSLAAMCADAEVVHLHHGDVHPWLEAGALPAGLVVVVDGAMCVSDPAQPEGDDSYVNAGETPGAAELLAGSPLAESIRALGDVTAFQVSRAALETAARTIPGFLLSIRRHGPIPQLWTDRARPYFHGDVVAVLAGIAGASLVSGLTTWLARDVAHRYRDDVLLVRVVPELPASPESTDGATHRTVTTGQLDAAMTTAWCSEGWEVVLLDLSALGIEAAGDTRLHEALQRLGAPVRTSYIFESDDAWTALALRYPLALRRWVLPTAILGRDAVRAARGNARREVGDAVGSVLGAAARGAVDQLVRSAKWAATRVTRTVAREIGTLGSREARAVGLGSPWPLGAVRLVLPADAAELLGAQGPRASIDELKPEPYSLVSESLGRWGRACTGRRVGLALGGAGALSYATLAIIEGLDDRQVPIDIVSGTSFGAVVGAFWVCEGRAGLKRLVTIWPQISAVLSTTSFSTVMMEAWIDWQLGDRDVTDLPVPFIPVGTAAATITEWDMRSGCVGEGVRISGSLPPFAPTIRGHLRLLDGGLAADVSTRILREEGADLVVAANSFPAPLPVFWPPVWIPFVTSFVQTLNPLGRMLDSARGYQAMWRFSAGNQAQYADVMWNAPAESSLPVAFWQGAQLAERSARSAQTKRAVEEAHSRWDQLRWRQIDPHTFAPGAPHAVAFDSHARAGAGLQEVLSEQGRRVVDGVANTLRAKPSARAVIRTSVRGERSRADGVDARADAVRRRLVAAGIDAARIDTVSAGESTGALATTSVEVKTVE